MFHFLKYCWLYEKAFHIHWGTRKFFLSLRDWCQGRADKSYGKYEATVAVMDKMDEAEDKRNKPRKTAEFVESIFNRE